MSSDGSQGTTGTGQLRFGIIEKELLALRRDADELRDDLVGLREVIAGHEVRFDNGRKVMGEIKQDVDTLKPRAPDWQKLLLAGLSVVAILMGAQLWLTDALNDRVTHSRLEQRLVPIEEAQNNLMEEIRALASVQSSQQQKLNEIHGSLNTLVEHTLSPPPRNRRRP